MYCTPNFKTKKQLKEAVKAAADGRGSYPNVYSPGPFPAKSDGIEYLEGPHYPAPHTWYAKVQVKGGLIIKVLS